VGPAFAFSLHEKGYGLAGQPSWWDITLAAKNRRLPRRNEMKAG